MRSVAKIGQRSCESRAVCLQGLTPTDSSKETDVRKKRGAKKSYRKYARSQNRAPNYVNNAKHNCRARQGRSHDVVRQRSSIFCQRLQIEIIRSSVMNGNHVK